METKDDLLPVRCDLDLACSAVQSQDVTSGLVIGTSFCSSSISTLFLAIFYGKNVVWSLDRM